jgi:hypothetical protein
MSVTVKLCEELQLIQGVIGLAGNPPLRSQPRTVGQCAQTAEDILRHIETAEQATSRTELRERLQAETMSVLASIKRHVGDIARCADGAGFRWNRPGPVPSAQEAMTEQFAELRDKCSYPLMDVLQRISAIAEATPIPADAITGERATQLYWATREDLRQAVQDGELRSYRDVYEPASGLRRYSGAQLAKLFERRR